MDVACPNCPAMYPISEQKLAGRLVRFRCKACGHGIVVDGRVAPSSLPPQHLGGHPSLAPPAVVQESIPVGALAPSGPPSTPASLGPDARRAAAPATPSNSRQAPPSAPPASRPPPSAPLGGPLSSAPYARHPFEERAAEPDPSVYEDETVAMTAHELEAVADAKSHHSVAAPAPTNSNPPPKPPSQVPPSPAVVARPHYPDPIGHPAAAHPPGSVAGVDAAPAPRRAESWAVGSSTSASVPPSSHPPTLRGHSPNTHTKPSAPPPHSLPPHAPPPHAPPPQAYAPQAYAPQAELHALPLEAAAPWAPPPQAAALAPDDYPAPRERRWVFPVLLLLLGAGGLVLGALLGRTWLSQLWGPPTLVPAAPAPTLATPAPAQPVVELPTFDLDAAHARLEEAASDAVHCLNADTAPLAGNVVARFAHDGKVEALELEGSVAEANEAPCIRSIFEKMSVPPFRGASARAERQLDLRPRP